METRTLSPVSERNTRLVITHTRVCLSVYLSSRAGFSDAITKMIQGQIHTCLHFVCGALAAEPIGPDGPRPAHFLALVGRPYLGPADFLGDVNFFFVYIAIITGENFQ